MATVPFALNTARGEDSDVYFLYTSTVDWNTLPLIKLGGCENIIQVLEYWAEGLVSQAGVGSSFGIGVCGEVVRVYWYSTHSIVTGFWISGL